MQGLSYGHFIDGSRENLLIYRPFHWPGKEKYDTNDRKQERMLILVPKNSIADEEGYEEHVDR